MSLERYEGRGSDVERRVTTEARIMIYLSVVSDGVLHDGVDGEFALVNHCGCLEGDGQDSCDSREGQRRRQRRAIESL